MGTGLCLYNCSNRTSEGYCQTTYCINPLYNRIHVDDDRITTGVKVYSSNNTVLPDVVQVIRCKDCKWHKNNFCHNFNVVGFTDTDYCSMGRKKE